MLGFKTGLKNTHVHWAFVNIGAPKNVGPWAAARTALAQNRACFKFKKVLNLKLTHKQILIHDPKSRREQLKNTWNILK